VKPEPCIENEEEVHPVLRIALASVGPISLPINKLIHNLICWAGSRTLLKGRVIK
jgi:hypothetical protein